MANITKRRVNRNKLVKLEVALLFAGLVLIGFVAGRYTAPTKVETVTYTQTVEVPVEKTELPTTAEITYYDVPLSHSMQRYLTEICADENVPVSLVMAMIEHESHFNPEIVSDTNDYGLMQINECNHFLLEEQYRCADMLDSYQNVYCGIKIIAAYLEKYEDYGKALMAYNMGEYGAEKAWKNGISSTSYSETILSLMEKYEQEVNGNAKSSANE